MSRQPRLDLPGIPRHVIQRGNNRQPCFLREQDYRIYLALLPDASINTDCSIHAYVLMTNHVHLLISPHTKGGISRCMKSLGRRYITYFNRTHRRSGTLWEGRYKSCLLDTERHLLTCYRYIELNPVRAAMTDRPEGYPWSSHAFNGLNRLDAVLTPHAEYLALGTTPRARCDAYLALFKDVISEDRLAEIRAYIQ